MGDDLDDLLNEVETKFCATRVTSANDSRDRVKSPQPVRQKTSTVPPSSREAKTSNPKGGGNLGKDELNSMIDDIFDDTSLPEPDPVLIRKTQPSSNSTSKSQTFSKASGSAKCFPVSIGGTTCESGISTAANQRICDRLRCTDCDFSVEIFDDVCWHPNTDYLFLRNNVPDYNKLKVNLVKRRGWRAYACQCKSKSVEDLIGIQDTNLNCEGILSVCSTICVLCKPLMREDPRHCRVKLR